MGLAGAWDDLGATARGGGPAWAAASGTAGMVAARNNAAAVIPRRKLLSFQENLFEAIGNAASQIRPRVYYDPVTAR